MHWKPVESDYGMHAVILIHEILTHKRQIALNVTGIVYQNATTRINNRKRVAHAVPRNVYDLVQAERIWARRDWNRFAEIPRRSLSIADVVVYMDSMAVRVDGSNGSESRP